VVDFNIESQKVGIDVILLKGEMYFLGFKKHMYTLLIFLFENEIVVISLTIVVFDAGYYPVKHLFCFLYKGRAGFAIIE
jgi:hypothetical protein